MDFRKNVDFWKCVNFRKKYEKRIKELKVEMEKKEAVIREYMKINNHPGLNYKGTLITLLKFSAVGRATAYVVLFIFGSSAYTLLILPYSGGIERDLTI